MSRQTYIQLPRTPVRQLQIAAICVYLGYAPEEITLQAEKDAIDYALRLAAHNPPPPPEPSASE